MKYTIARFVGVSVIFSAVVAFVVFLRARQPTALGRTESPHRRYKVEIVQKRFLLERAVYLEAYRDGEPIVRRKLLYTGDVLDSDFRDLYPNYSWTSESALRIGSEVAGDEAQATLLTVVNESPDRLSYLLVEAAWNKIVLFDLDSGTSVNLLFPVSGGFTSQGEFAESKKRLGVGTSIPRNREAGPFEIIIREDGIIVRDGQRVLEKEHCCASDRPDFDHELLY